MPVAGLRGAGPPWLRSTTSRAGSWPAADPQPRPPGALAHPLTPAPSCSAALPSLCNRVLLPAAPWGFRPPFPSLPHAPSTKAPFWGKLGWQVQFPRSPHPSPAPRPARGPGMRRSQEEPGAGAWRRPRWLALPPSWRCTASNTSPQQRSRCRDPPSWRAFPAGSPRGGRGGKKWPKSPSKGVRGTAANFCLELHRPVTFRSTTCLEKLGKCPDGPRKEMMQFSEDIPSGSF